MLAIISNIFHLLFCSEAGGNRATFTQQVFPEIC